jgi:hypothetical protein
MNRPLPLVAAGIQSRGTMFRALPKLDNNRVQVSYHPSIGLSSGSLLPFTAN